MNALAAWFATAWRSQRTTVGLLLAFVLWAVLGAGLDLADLQANRPQRIRQHIVAADDMPIDLTGRVDLLDIRHSPYSPVFRGPLTIEFDNRRAAPCMLAVELMVVEAPMPREMAVHDEHGAILYAWRPEPADYRQQVRVPLPPGAGMVQIRSNQPDLALRHVACQFATSFAPAGHAALPGAILVQDRAVTVRRAAGWIDETGEKLDGRTPERLMTRAVGELEITTRRPGRHRVSITLRRLAPSIPAPEVRLDQMPIATDDLAADGEFETMQFDALLTGTHLLTLRTPMPGRTRLTLWPGKDPRPRAYAIWPGRMRIEAK